MAARNKRRKSKQDRSADHKLVKDSLKKELLGQDRVSKTFIHRQLESISQELHQASQSGRNQGLRGLIAIYLAGLACFFVKKD